LPEPAPPAVAEASALVAGEILDRDDVLGASEAGVVGAPVLSGALTVVFALRYSGSP
jgi:hypothetical protein